MHKQVFYKPHPLLEKYVRYFWSLEFDNLSRTDSTLRIMADRFPKIILQNMNGRSGIKMPDNRLLPISFVTGVVTKPVEYGIAHKYSHFGISFYPHALKHFLRVDAQEITDKFPDLLNFVSTDFNDMILGAGSNHLRISKLNCFLIEQLEKNAYRNGNVVINDVLLNTYKYRNHSVKEVANNYKLSERSIERKFREWVGVSPKKYLQIFRFEETYHKLNGNNFRNLSEVAFANGYSDQSHFIRNFRKFSGIPPSDYIDELKNEERGSGILFWNLTRDASNYKMHELA